MESNSHTIQDLGTLEGRILVFGGVYSNFHALFRMKEIADELKIPSSQVICTGDIVGYCAFPEETVQMVTDWGIQSIAGNVELQLREGEEDCGCDFSEGSRCDMFSRQWYPFAQKSLSPRSIEWMKGLPHSLKFDFAGKEVRVVHGSPAYVSEYVFRSTPWHVKASHFENSGADVILAGHCGLPFHHIEGGKMWLNPGVIGMPANEGSPRVWFMLISDRERGLAYSHHSFFYPFEEAASAMERHLLPVSYANTLRTGIWDNCEILPPEETSLQGIPLKFGPSVSSK